MTPDPIPIPAHIWKRIQAFLREGKTGKVVLNIHCGSVRDTSIEERISNNQQDIILNLIDQLTPVMSTIQNQTETAVAHMGKHTQEQPIKVESSKRNVRK